LENDQNPKKKKKKKKKKKLKIKKKKPKTPQNSPGTFFCRSYAEIKDRLTDRTQILKIAPNSLIDHS
jgi:hypothetical protein